MLPFVEQLLPPQVQLGDQGTNAPRSSLRSATSRPRDQCVEPSSTTHARSPTLATTEATPRRCSTVTTQMDSLWTHSVFEGDALPRRTRRAGHPPRAFGDWSGFHGIAAVANQLPEHTAGPHAYRCDVA